MKVRIYGTATEGKRELWKNPRTGKKQYWIVTRSQTKHNRGKIMSRRKWTPKTPKQTLDVTKDGILLEAETGEELEKMVKDYSRRYNWIGKKVKSPKVKTPDLDQEDYQEYITVKGYSYVNKNGKTVTVKEYRRRKRK